MHNLCRITSNITFTRNSYSMCSIQYLWKVPLRHQKSQSKFFLPYEKSHFYKDKGLVVMRFENARTGVHKLPQIWINCITFFYLLKKIGICVYFLFTLPITVILFFKHRQKRKKRWLMGHLDVQIILLRTYKLRLQRDSERKEIRQKRATLALFWW